MPYDGSTPRTQAPAGPGCLLYRSRVVAGPAADVYHGLCMRGGYCLQKLRQNGRVYTAVGSIIRRQQIVVHGSAAMAWRARQRRCGTARFPARSARSPLPARPAATCSAAGSPAAAAPWRCCSWGCGRCGPRSPAPLRGLTVVRHCSQPRYSSTARLAKPVRHHFGIPAQGQRLRRHDVEAFAHRRAPVLNGLHEGLRHVVGMDMVHGLHAQVGQRYGFTRAPAVKRRWG